MTSFKDPSFQDRVSRAAEARQKALDQLRAKPPVDEKVAAERQAARLKREAKEAEKRAEKKAAVEASKAAKAAKAEAASNKVAPPPPPTEEERKAARDARYAARKNRK